MVTKRSTPPTGGRVRTLWEIFADEASAHEQDFRDCVATERMANAAESRESLNREQ